MYLEAVFCFYILLNHLVGYSLFWLITFCSLFNIIKRNFALTLAKLYFYIDYAVRFFVGKKYNRLDMARAGVWYTDNISVEDCVIEAPKNFRRCDGVTLRNVSMSNAAETLWNCKNIKLDRVVAKGDYFAMNCENVEIDGLTLYGNYSFDGVKNMTVKNSKLLSKDAFWNSDNVTVYDSFISGEYLGWNAKNLTLVNCTVESLQGMCYIDDLVMKNCKLINTTLAFEYSTVQADISGSVNSVINPKGGTITAESIGELIMEKDKIDPTLTKIICRADKAVNV